MNAAGLIEALEFNIQRNATTLIVGAPGIGKTQIVKQVTDSQKARMIITHPVVSDPTDYKGLPFADAAKNVAHFLPFGDLNALINAKDKLVFFIDDVGQAPQSVQAALMQLVEERRVNGHIVSDNVVFIAATNRIQDKAGVVGLIEPFKSRSHIIDLEVSLNDWCKWALTIGNMPTELIAFLKFRPELLHKFEPTREIKNSPCPRTIAKVGQMQNDGLKYNSGIFFEMVKGYTGESFAIEYLNFCKLFNDLPNVDQIILNPIGAPIPQEPGSLYALTGALAHRANPQNLENIITYLERIGPEYTLSAMKDATTKNPAVCNTRAYSKFASDYNTIF